MEQFDFPFHSKEEQFQNSGFRVKFGGSYEFAAKGSAPVQSIFSITLTGMKYVFNPDGSVNLTAKPKQNIEVFRAFYLRHEQYKKFNYPCPIRGLTRVRFNEPPTIPAVEGNQGVLPNITITLITQP